MNDHVVSFPIDARRQLREAGPQGSDGRRLPLIEAVDHEGKPVWVPVMELQRTYVPEGWERLNWLVVQVSAERQPPSQPIRERCAYAELSALSLPVILPVGVRQVRQRSACGRPLRGHVHRPYVLLPRYLLVGLSDGDMQSWGMWHERICACRNVAGVLGVREGGGDRPVRLNQQGFARFRQALNSGEYDESVREACVAGGIRVGDLVEILDGPFEYLSGPVKRFRTRADGAKRFASKAYVRLEVLGGERDVEIPVDSLRLVD